MKGSKNTQWTQRIIQGVILVFVFALSSVNCGLVFAQSGLEGTETFQTNPKDRERVVTATVVPQDAPPPPGLSRPRNNEILTSGVVAFQWTQVTHTAAIDRYELYLNGSLKFGPIHITNQTTDDYTLTLAEGLYTLTLKPDKWLPDGIYTWKIRVIDVNDRGTDSTTWTFTVDSTSPNILLTKIDGQTTAISALDPSTIPPEPVEVRHRTPEIQGHTEASSEVQLAVTYPDGSIRHYKNTAHLDGTFYFTLESLPLRQAVSLTFTAFDLAGNSRVLDGVRIMYQPRVIRVVFPPIVPDPPVLEIFVTLPVFPRLVPPTLKDFPPVFEPILAPFFPEPDEVPEETKLVEVPFFDAEPWLWGWLMLLAGYVVSVFLLTRNSLRYFFTYLGSLVSLWLRGPGKGQHSWLSSRGEPLPFYGFTLTWLDEQRQYHTRLVVTSVLGRWGLSAKLGQLFSFQTKHSAMIHPVDPLRVEVPKGGVVVNGPSFTFGTGSKVEQREEVLFLPLESPLVAYARLREPVRGWQVWCWVPRVILGLELLLALYILWHMKTWLTIVMLLFIFLVMLRDVQARLRQRLEVYGS